MAFNKTQLKNLVDNNLPDNSSGLITPENNRALVKEIIDTAFATVASISALKNYDTTELNDGDKLEVAGYYEKNDGGGGLFVWDADSTEADNGGTIIQATGITTGRWKRPGGNEVNVKWFGAKGDSVNDDLTAISSAATLARTNNVPVYFPAGHYVVSDDISINYQDGVWIGEDKRKTIIRLDDSGLTTSTAIITNPIKIKELFLYGTNRNCTAIRIKNQLGGFKGWIEILNVDIFETGQAIWCDAVFNVKYNNMRIRLNKNGVLFNPTNTSGVDDGYVTDQYFDNVFIDQNDEYGFYLNPELNSPNIVFRDCALQSNSTLVSHPFFISTTIDPILFDNCYIEGTGGTTAFMRLGGRCTFINTYENTTTGFDLGSVTVNATFIGMRQTSSSPGFLNGSSNSKISFDNCLIQSSVTGSYIEYKKSTVNGVYYAHYVKGNNLNADIDFRDSTNILLGDKATLEPRLHPAIRSEEKIKSINTSGTSVDLATFTINTVNDAFSATIPFQVLGIGGGIKRQVASGVLFLNAVFVSGGATASVSIIGMNKSISSGTMSDPVFTVSSVGSVITLSIEFTSSVDTGDVFFYLQDIVGVSPSDVSFSII